MKVTMSTKVIGLFIIGGLAPFIAIGLISYKTASTSLREQAINQLTSIREMKKAELEKYFVNRTTDIKTLASSTMTFNALEAFKETFKELGSEKARKLYIFDNPYPQGKKVELIDAQDASDYSMYHAKFHPIFKNYLEESKHFYDLFLVDIETGDIIYTVWKEDDFGTNLCNGKYMNTNIGELVRSVNISQDNAVKQVDFRSYEPSNGAPARFIACPILNEDGKKTGTLILQLSIEAIDAIMAERSGLGETGEAYLVGADKLMRSNSRFSKESTVLKQKVDTAAVQEALNNQAGAKVIKDYRGVSVLSAYSPIKVGEMTWAIIAEIDEAEALKAAVSLRNRMLIIGVIIAIGVAALGYLVIKITGRVTNLLKNLVHELTEGSSHIASASQQISASSQSLSQGTTEQAAAVEETSSSMEEMVSMTKQNADHAREAAQLAVICSKSAEEGSHSMAEMNNAMNEIAQSSKKIGGIIKTIDSIASQTDVLALNASGKAAKAGESGRGFAVVAEEVRNLAQRSTNAAKDTSSLVQESLRKTNIGTELAKKCSKSVQNILSNIKKMTTLVSEGSVLSLGESEDAEKASMAIQQIKQALQESTANAEETVSVVKELVFHVNEINQYGKKTDEVIGTIDSIALQTNLLALNASVEAAKAEEHGKGFIGVAEEVRNLAQRSVAAGKEISSLIQDNLQKTDKGAELAKKCTESFQSIVTNVKKVSNLINEISVASQEQSEGVTQVSNAIQQIDQVLQQNAANAEETASAGKQLASQSQTLNNLVTRIANELGGRNGKVKDEEKHIQKTHFLHTFTRRQLLPTFRMLLKRIGNRE